MVIPRAWIEKSGILSVNIVHKVNGTEMPRIGESRHPVFRAMSPLSRGVLKSKGGGKLSLCRPGND